MRLRITLASGDLRQSLGFFSAEIGLVGEELTVEDILKNVGGRNGRTLADIVITDGMVSPRYAIFLDGQNIETLQGLKTHVKGGGKIVVMDVIARIAGGLRS
jgi:sulfur carrier protein ThiS